MAKLLKKELADFITEQFGLDPGSLDSDLPLFSSSLLDSTSMVTIVAFLEEKIGLTIDADDLTLDNFDSISAILTFCDARTTR
jgi:acyl carrier protein